MIARWDAPESLLAELAQANPNSAVRRAAHDLAIWTETHDCTAPEALLRDRVTWDRYRIQPGARPAAVDPPLDYGERSDPDYAAFRLALVARVLAGLNPLETAALLAEHRQHFAALDHGRVGEQLDDEIAELRATGPYWNPDAAQPLLQLALVPRAEPATPQGAKGGVA